MKHVSLWFFKKEPLAGFDSSSMSDVLALCGASVKMQHDGALLFLSGTTVPQQTATTAVEAHKIICLTTSAGQIASCLAAWLTTAADSEHV